MRDDKDSQVGAYQLVHAFSNYTDSVNVQSGIRLVKNCDLGLKHGELQNLRPFFSRRLKNRR